MKKRLFILITTLIMLLSGCANNSTVKKDSVEINKTGLPIVNEKLTAEVFATRSPAIGSFSDMPYFRIMEERTNIQLDITDLESSVFAEKKKLLFASGDMPDMFYGGWVLSTTEVVNYGMQGLLLPLENLIEQYAPNISKVLNDRPDIKNQITAPDGHIYALPTLNENNPLTNEALVINKAWLDKVGMSVPTTTDEFYKVLKAFKNNDLNGNGINDEMPLIFKYKDHINGITSLFGSFGVLDTASHFMVNNGKVVFSPIQPGYKEAVRYFSKLVSEGLMDMEGFTLTDITSKQRSVPPIAGAFLAWSEYMVNVNLTGDKSGKGDYLSIPPLKGPNGDQLWARRAFTATNNFAFAISTKSQYPEALIRWADYCYDDDISIQTYRGLYDIDIKKLDNGKFEEISNGNKIPVENSVPGVSGFYKLFKGEYTLNSPSPSDVFKSKCDEMYAPYVEKEAFPGEALLTSSDTERMGQLTTDIVQYVEKCTAEWILNGGIDSQWDAYITKLNQMGLEEYIKLNQKILDSKYK